MSALFLVTPITASVIDIELLEMILTLIDNSKFLL